MKSKLRQLNNFFIFFLLAFIFFLLSFNLFKRGFHHFAADFFYPYIAAPAAVADTVAAKDLMLKSKSTLAAECLKLRRVNEELKFRLQNQTVIEAQNERLRRMLDLPQNKKLKLLAAEIILRDPYNYNQSFTINKGSSHNVKSGAVIVGFTSGGRLVMVGRVRDVSAYTALVDTLDSDNCHFAALTGPERYPALFEGHGNYRGICGMLKFITLDAQLNEGDSVCSADTGGSTALRIPMGRISNIRKSDNSMYLVADLRAYCNFAALKFVYVITESPGAVQ